MYSSRVIDMGEDGLYMNLRGLSISQSQEGSNSRTDPVFALLLCWQLDVHHEVG